MKIKHDSEIEFSKVLTHKRKINEKSKRKIQKVKKELRGTFVQ